MRKVYNTEQDYGCTHFDYHTVIITAKRKQLRYTLQTKISQSVILADCNIFLCSVQCIACFLFTMLLTVGIWDNRNALTYNALFVLYLFFLWECFSAFEEYK